MDLNNPGTIQFSNMVTHKNNKYELRGNKIVTPRFSRTVYEKLSSYQGAVLWSIASSYRILTISRNFMPELERTVLLNNQSLMQPRFKRKARTSQILRFINVNDYVYFFKIFKSRLYVKNIYSCTTRIRIRDFYIC